MKRWVKAVLAGLLVSLWCISASGCGPSSFDMPEWLEQELCDHVYGEEEILEEATCTEDGKVMKICSECGLEKTVRVKPLGHNVVEDEGVAATCYTDGWTSGAHCADCGLVLIERNLIVAGHEADPMDDICPVCGTVLWTPYY